LLAIFADEKRLSFISKLLRIMGPSSARNFIKLRPKPKARPNFNSDLVMGYKAAITRANNYLRFFVILMICLRKARSTLGVHSPA